MMVFDDILPCLTNILTPHLGALKSSLYPIYINRDLNGRVRLIVNEIHETDPNIADLLAAIAIEIFEKLSPHGFPPEHAILWEVDPKALLSDKTKVALDGCPGVFVIDRLAVDGDWSVIAPVAETPQRVAFFSIKGGVGRSTALAATAWALAEQGLRVLVLDLDLESPGLSSSLLPSDRRPKRGIVDWLVEDLVDNGDAVLGDIVASSLLSREGEISVVPAHGGDPGDYIGKLGRVWMPKLDAQGGRETWTKRLARLLDLLEARLKPDIVLLDSRAGIDETAAACLTGLGASLILLFALDGDQTWTGARIVCRHWLNTGVVLKIRERLQVVGAMLPETDTANYLDSLTESAWTVFSDEVYDEVPAGSVSNVDGSWSFDRADNPAPHTPWPIRWHRGFAALRNLHDRLDGIDPKEVYAIFGPLIDGVRDVTGLEPVRP